jgi:transcriptional regulator with XRE-family HTH domain
MAGRSLYKKNSIKMDKPVKKRLPSGGEALADVSLEVVTGRMCERLRQLRKQRGWTLEQLATASGVSRSMLSQIERGQANPTLAVAFRIARAFDRSLGDLLDEPNSLSPISVIRSSDPTYRFRSDDACRIRTLYPMQFEKDVEFYEVWLAPGEALKSAPHYAGTRELLTVGKGRVAVTAAKHRCEVDSGDAAHFPADVPHAIENVGGQEALLYLVVICRPD